MRCAKFGTKCVCLALLAVGMSVSLCRGNTIALDIANPGFDAQDVSGAGWAVGATDWTVTGQAGTQLGNAGLAAQSSPNWAFLGDSAHASCGLGQLLKVGGNALRVQAGGQIAIDVYQGHRTDYMAGDVQQLEVEIWRDAIGTGSLAYTSGNLGDVAAGTWTLRSVSYPTTGDDVGKDLYLRLWNPIAVQVQVDSVAGSYTAVPEPCTLLLCVTGVLGLLAYAWRKRK